MFKITDKDKMVKHLEKDNKKDIKKFLKTLKPDGFFFNIQQGMLSRAGISDTLGVYHGRFFAFECKSKVGKPTPLQRAFLRLVTRAGGICGVTKTVADIKQLINLDIEKVSNVCILADVYLKFCTPNQAFKLLNRWNEKNTPHLEAELWQVLNQSLKKV